MTAVMHQDPSATGSFGARLRAAMGTRGPLCVGIDPHASLLSDWGLPDTVSGLERFALTVVDALGGQVAVLKPQSAFFERHGSAGIRVLERTISAARDGGALVVLDIKRGDIGSTAAAYADAYLDPASSLCADAVTLSPYLGFGSLQPLLDRAAKHDRGVFVLVMTSNPEGGQVQLARRDGVTVAESVLRQLAEANAGASPWGSYGAVVGATVASAPDGLAINGPLLAPGFGAQGGTVADLRRIFAGVLPDVVPSTSRQVLSAGPDVAALRTVTAEIAATLAEALR